MDLLQILTSVLNEEIIIVEKQVILLGNCETIFESVVSGDFWAIVEFAGLSR